MEDPLDKSGAMTNLKLVGSSSHENAPYVASTKKPFNRRSLSQVVSKNQMIRGVPGDLALFLVKFAALETTRRLSKAKFPLAWHSLQACQMLCYPPLKWIQRWAPFKCLVQGMQMLSRPLLVLSIVTAFSSKSDDNTTSDDLVSHSHDNVNKKSSSAQLSGDLRNNDVFSNYPSSESWLIKLYEELEMQGIVLPERINENELRRFYTAADGDFPYLLSSIKRTVRWRETYNILSEEQLQMWSNVVFWHGYDVRHRPCLVVRLGLACTSLSTHDRPRFVQAIVSQMDHGILNLADPQNPGVIVLVDCDGLSPFRLPMQMMRSCSLLFQDHFPNCVDGLFVIRLPPVVRMMVQTIMKVLKPVTRQKLKFLGEAYKEVLSEYFQELPVCLGGNCLCAICSRVSSNGTLDVPLVELASVSQLVASGLNYDDNALIPLRSEVEVHQNFDQLIRTGMIGLLMFCVFVAFFAEIFGPDS